jgi:hypothetical protein
MDNQAGVTTTPRRSWTGKCSFRQAFWYAVKHIQSREATSVGVEMHRWRVIGAATRSFLRKTDAEERKRYAEYLGISRAELVKWMGLCKERAEVVGRECL